MIKGLIMDRCVLLTSTPEWVVSPHRAITRAPQRVDYTNNTHLSMINPDYNIMLAISVTIYQYSAY